MKKTLSLCILLTIGMNAFTQDVIVQRNGEEIQAIILEIKPDVVTYKVWSNQDGPLYTKNKNEIFMIKYTNGSKDVFEIKNGKEENVSLSTSPGSVYLGTWYHKNYDGENNKSILTITKAAMGNFLLEYKHHERIDALFYSADGSFKEIGYLDHGMIIVNSLIKVSLLNENTLMLYDSEFYRAPKKTRIVPSNNESLGMTQMNNDREFSSKEEEDAFYHGLKTTHSGHFFDRIKDEEYRTWGIRKGTLSVIKNLFYRASEMSLDSASFGHKKYYNLDQLSIKEGDSLIVHVGCNKFFPNHNSNKKWKGEELGFLLSIQIEDASGKEYLAKDYTEPLKLTEPNNLSSITDCIVNADIVIDPATVSVLPKSKDLYLNMFITSNLHKKFKWEGFLKFKVE